MLHSSRQCADTIADKYKLMKAAVQKPKETGSHMQKEKEKKKNTYSGRLAFSR